MWICDIPDRKPAYSLTGLQFTKNHDDGILLILFLLNIIIVYFYSAAMIRRQGRICGKRKNTILDREE